MGRHAGGRSPLEENLTLSRAVDASEDIKKGCFPSTVGTDQPDKFPCIDPKGDIRERRDPAKTEKTMIYLEQ
jgi:hypothetical protein